LWYSFFMRVVAVVQELGFDFLRDNLAMTPDSVVQRRPFNYCIVDEADTILIDEACHPLILSRPGAAAVDKYAAAMQIAETLRAGRHYTVDIKNQRVKLTPAGYSAAEKVVGNGLLNLQDPWAFYIINAVKARELFARDRDYIALDGALNLVDASTGRVLQGRKFPDGLQQALETKEGLSISADTQVVAKVSYQFLFRLFPKLAGISSTALSDSAELYDTYQLRVFPVPAALPAARRDFPDAVFRSQEDKLQALLRLVRNRHDAGQPVLLGTTSVEASEQLAQALRGVGETALWPWLRDYS
jgi:preprotein translocase subunit SecA